MMRPEDDAVSPRKRRRIAPPQAAPYILRELLADLPLANEDSNADVHITCVEYWNDNLYIGTSAAEVLHFVCLPPDPSDESSESSFILASRLPIFHSQNSAASTGQGVQQIILLPSVNKACILCNGTLTFYLLPELSPAFGNTKVNNCRWIGGIDLNRVSDDVEAPAIMVALQNRIMLVKIGDDARRMRNIEFPGCLVAARRGSIACAADTHAYSLLEVEHQQKIPLFPISSSNETFESGHVEEMPTALPVPSKTSPSSPNPNSPPVEGQHGQSLGSPSILQDRSSSATPEPSPASETPQRSNSQDRDGNSEDASQDPQSNIADKKPLPPLPKILPTRLKPHVVSASANEFLLVTGTAEKEPGVGMFVNMDGDMERSTINFDRYPESVAIDTRDQDDPIQSVGDGKEERIIAVIEYSEDGQLCKHLEVQRLDIDPSEAEKQKRWVEIPLDQDSKSVQVGLRHTISSSQLEHSEMGGLLRMVRLRTPSLLPHIPATDPRSQASIEQLQKEKDSFESQELTNTEGSRKGDGSSERDWEAERNAEEARFARGLGRGESSLIMWAGSRIWRIMRNPLTVQLDDVLQKAQVADYDSRQIMDRDIIMDIIQSAQNIEPASEGDFLGLSYVKQKASLMLFGDLVFMDQASRSDTVIGATEKVLVDGNLDPRMVLILIPLLRKEVLQGPQGIWIQAGLAATADRYIRQTEETEKTEDNSKTGAADSSILEMVKRFLLSWQQKRGYGSITDETYVFDSVDAALLHLLLEQDAGLTAEQRSSSLIRNELNRLVDNWKGNFDRAVALLESYHRLFILSRLYQSQKMSRNVLKTWRRIIEGEQDAGGEMIPSGAELQMRRYLVKIKDAQLVEEYGSWLAGRNPKLGIQVFADGTSRVKLEPADVVGMLKEQAPNAVQAYLEHLVFFKNYSQYADDLVSYYLDTVLSVLQSSPEARESLSESYSTYRALRPPKPTYMSFITANIPSEPWWQTRLRLLQLLGGGSSTQFSSMSPAPPRLSYSIPAVLARIEPYQDELVSESIILDGLQGRHQEALRLLTHGLSDYDSAVRYCLFGGPRSTSSTGALTEFAERPLQTELFRHLLDEFLRIEDPTDCLERTTDLLSRFSSWFDVREVLELVPDDWSVEIMSGFLGRVFRVLVSQTREVKIERALSAGLNLRVGTEYIEGMEKAAGWIEDDEGVRGIREGGQGNEKQVPGQVDGSDFGDIVDGANDNDNVLA